MAIRLIVVAMILLLGAHRLPAPIQEVPESPTPAPAASGVPKAKARARARPADVDVPAKKRSNINDESTTGQTDPAGKFDGVWMGTLKKRYWTLVIKNGKTATETFEVAEESPGDYGFDRWSDMPKGTDKRSSVSWRYTRESHNLALEGSTLVIQWYPWRLLNWAPKSIPYNWFDEREDTRKMLHEEEREQYTLDGDKLVTPKLNGVVFHLVR